MDLGMMPPPSGRGDPGHYACTACNLPQSFTRTACLRCGSHELSFMVTRYRRPVAPATTSHHSLLARYTIASWAQLRLLWVGSSDDASPLSRLPPELVLLIARFATSRPACWADSRLRWCRAKAKAAADGTACVPIGGMSKTIGESEGIECHYDRATRRFKLYLRQDKRSGSTTWREITLIGSWSEAEFLVNTSFVAQWKQRFKTMRLDN